MLGCAHIHQPRVYPEMCHSHGASLCEILTQPCAEGTASLHLTSEEMRLREVQRVAPKSHRKLRAEVGFLELRGGSSVVVLG